MIENDYICDCGCGETITIKSEGALTRTVIMTPCTARAKRGVTALQLNQSAVAELEPANQPHPRRYIVDCGLVGFIGA